VNKKLLLEESEMVIVHLYLRLMYYYVWPDVKFGLCIWTHAVM